MDKEKSDGIHSASSSSGSSHDHIVIEKDALHGPKHSVPEIKVMPSSSSLSSSSKAGSSQAQNCLMEQPGYDPNRIPSSIFGTKTMEWSVASNESLFSIHMGNSSFSRDHVPTLYKSGELSDLILSNSNSLPPLAETENNRTSSVSINNPGDDLNGKLSTLNLDESPSRLPPVMEVEHPGRTSMVLGGIDEPAVKNAMEKPTIQSLEKSQWPPPEDNRSSASVSLRSDGSTNSAKSFAFPVFPGEANSLKEVEKEPPQQLPPTQPIEQRPLPPPPQQTTENHTEPTPNAAPTGGWLSYFSCCFCALPCMKAS